jgi:hypothetical protein
VNWRQAKKIIKKYAGNFSTDFFSEHSHWNHWYIPHRALKQKHIKRWFEGEDE